MGAVAACVQRRTDAERAWRSRQAEQYRQGMIKKDINDRRPSRPSRPSRTKELPPAVREGCVAPAASEGSLLQLSDIFSSIMRVVSPER